MLALTLAAIAAAAALTTPVNAAAYLGIAGFPPATQAVVVSSSSYRHVFSAPLGNVTLSLYVGGSREVSTTLGGGEAYDAAVLKVIGYYDELTHKFIGFKANLTVRDKDYASPLGAWVITVIRDRIVSENITRTHKGVYVTYVAQAWFKVEYASLLPLQAGVTYDRYNLTCTVFIPADAVSSSLAVAGAGGAS